MMEEDMKTMLRQMVSSFEATELVDRKLVIREVLQELVLYGLSKSGFFDKVAFVGGTALRIFHGLRRFSEDLDFMVTEPVSIDFNDYVPEMKRQLSVLGVDVEVSEEERSNPDLVAGMVKGNTKELYLFMYSEDDLVKSIYKKECNVSGEIEESEYADWLDEVESVVKDSGKLGKGYPFSKTRWTYDSSRTGEDLASGITLTLILYDD